MTNLPQRRPRRLHTLPRFATFFDVPYVGKKLPGVFLPRSRQHSLWKAGATDAPGFIAKTADMAADPKRVTVPFLSILGGGDSPVFAQQAMRWHAEIPSTRKSFVLLDAASGADGHCQVNNRLRLVQEAGGWMDEIFPRIPADQISRALRVGIVVTVAALYGTYRFTG